MIEYVEYASPQDTSFKTAGIAILRKSLHKSLLLSNILAKFNLTSLDFLEKTRQIKNWIKRDRLVPRATPAIPSFGIPKSPKINTALKKTLRTGAVILMIVASDTRPILLTTAMYTSDIHQNIRPNDTTLK